MQQQDVVPVEDRSEFGKTVSRRDFRDLQFLFKIRIIDMDPKHEAIELGFWEGIGTFLFNRVLCAQYDERLIERVIRACGGDFVFLHRLQQGRLGFRRWPVDFVTQENVAEDRAFDKTHATTTSSLLFLENFRARNV